MVKALPVCASASPTELPSPRRHLGRYRETLLFLDKLREIASERTDLMVLRGYAYMKLKRFAAAKQIFEAVAATGNRDAQRGLAEVYAAQEIWRRKF
ncbi:TPR repeat protein (plasmid) [Sinorhizobium sojae CCBAU 05684]|uniref:TPR repeat protein n=1 Tax=Sinorhizobium sojae CCBAU 05684 TaxID=716928 RepID=A0A249PL56_9HYPH|nr:TPR repeat protein [Sinorhizobium sojae CCBAU 05684]